MTGAAATLIAVLALCFAGCGSGADDGSAVDPLTAKAAVEALECDGARPFFRAKGSYDSGLATVQSSPTEAVDAYVEE